MKTVMNTPTKLIAASLTLILCSLVLFGISQPTAPPNQHNLKSAPTEQPLTTDVIYIVRHADTQGGSNPDLSAAGQARAEHLASMLQDEQLAAVFVTNTNRSIQTGIPAATDAGITTTIYSPFDGAAVAAAITNIPGSNATLVVAHSNTVPLIITALGGPQFEDLEETEFDRLYAVTLSNGKHIRTLELHYE